MNGAIDALLSSLGPLAVLVVMGIVVAETGLLAGFFLPGDSLLFTTGLLVAQHTINLPIWLVIPLVTLAAVVGDQAGYGIGRRYGPRVLTRQRSRLLDPGHLDRAATFFDRYGPKAVVLARFVPVARTFTPVAAGAAKMRYRTYLAYNVVGGVAWCTTMLLAGYLLGGVPILRDHIELIVLGIVLVSLLPAVAAVLRAHDVRIAPWLTGLTGVAAAAGVILLADAATERDGLATHDPTVAADVATHRTTFLNHVASAASLIGSEASIAVLAAGVLVVLAGRRRFAEAGVLGVGMAGAAALVLGLKQLIDRARPGTSLRLGPADSSSSFPSGHTSMTAAFAALLVWLFWPHLTRAGRAVVVGAAGAVCLVVGASRVYLGYHWATDVIAAWLVVTAWLGLLLLAVSQRARPKAAPNQPAGTTGSGDEGARGTVASRFTAEATARSAR
ncbi:bifunctional DedA family/phosphatase PAP2 family protein [Nocardioides sp. URHA0032]|uniref:bifunctional DedA family/phosphatase PAP2 family protein n=1 Tax=Nocardioides sp. URHA0032 TaxID=1380388 RepID=UPI000684599F|nr:VTT domain-containing protein [Nocardioides sp. URHA0032]